MSSHTPAISILMPVRNEAQYLSDALSSLTRQSCSDWHCVIVDDGSTDATPDIVDRAAHIDSRFKLFRSNGVGLVAALNAGLVACTAPLLARMDGDDISHPRRLEYQLNYLNQHPEIGLIACTFRHFPRTLLKQGMRTYEVWQNSLSTHELIMRDLFVESPFVHPSIMVRRELLTEVGGYRDLGWPEDYDLWLRLAHNNIRFARTVAPLFFWRDHPERATRVMNEYAATAFRACKCYHLHNGFLKDVKSITIAGAGQEARAWQRLLSDHDIAVTSWIDVDKRKIGRLLHGAPVHGIDYLHTLHGSKTVVAIGVHGAREQFRTIAAAAGLREGFDFICVS